MKTCPRGFRTALRRLAGGLFLLLLSIGALAERARSQSFLEQFLDFLEATGSGSNPLDPYAEQRLLVQEAVGTGRFGLGKFNNPLFHMVTTPDVPGGLFAPEYKAGYPDGSKQVTIFDWCYCEDVGRRTGCPDDEELKWLLFMAMFAHHLHHIDQEGPMAGPMDYYCLECSSWCIEALVLCELRDLFALPNPVLTGKLNWAKCGVTAGAARLCAMGGKPCDCCFLLIFCAFWFIF